MKQNVYLSIIEKIWSKRKLFQFILEKELEEMTNGLYLLLMDELEETLGFKTDEEKTKEKFYTLVKQHKKDVLERMEKWLNEQEEKKEKKDVYSKEERIEKMLSFVREFSKYITIFEHNIGVRFIKEVLNPMFIILYEDYDVERNSVKNIFGINIDTNSAVFDIAREKVLNQINLLARGQILIDECMQNLAFLKEVKVGFIYRVHLFSKHSRLKIIDIEDNGNLHCLIWEKDQFEIATHLPMKKEFFVNLKKEFQAIEERTKAERELVEKWKESEGFWSEEYYILQTREKVVKKNDAFEQLKILFQEKNMTFSYSVLKKERGRIFVPYKEREIEYYDKKKEKIKNWKPIVEERLRSLLKEKEISDEMIKSLSALMEEMVGIEAEVHVITLPVEEKNEIYIFKNDESILSFVITEYQEANIKNA